MKINRFLKIIGFSASVVCLVSCSGHRIESRLKQAEELKGTRQFGEALELYKLVISDYPNDIGTAAAYVKLGDLYQFNFSDVDNAIEAYSKALKNWPASEMAGEAALKRAEALKSKGNVRGSIADLEWVSEHFPNRSDIAEIKLRIAECYLSLFDPYQAAIELEELLNHGKPEGELYCRLLFNLGESYLFLERYREALDVLKRVEDEFPDVPYMLDVRLRMVECMEKLNMIAEAITLQRRLKALYPDSEVVKKMMAGLERREGKNQKPEGEEFKILDEKLKVKKGARE